ncbi:nucleolar MIF4G domain-containing protein 1 homolog [Tachypleus tridentatus]|uniref:nucleolar MIF4G domain-containing protein 1 homolog n=1 Tax=Tachypleus tridentatus TaxID=6853 RepID=UPI003FD0BF05
MAKKKIKTPLHRYRSEVLNYFSLQNTENDANLSSGNINDEAKPSNNNIDNRSFRRADSLRKNPNSLPRFASKEDVKYDFLKQTNSKRGQSIKEASSFKIRVSSRKEDRKQKRLDQKSKRRNYFMNRNKSMASDQNSKEDVEESGTYNSIPRKDISISKESNVEQNVSTKNTKAKTRKRKKTNKTVEEVRKLQLLEANKEEDRLIKQLEKKIHLNRRKSKNLPKSFVDEGLDYILEVIDNPEDASFTKEISDGDSEFEDDLALALGKRTTDSMKESTEDCLGQSNKAKNLKDANNKDEDDFTSDFNSDNDEDQNAGRDNTDCFHTKYEEHSLYENHNNLNEKKAPKKKKSVNWVDQLGLTEKESLVQNECTEVNEVENEKVSILVEKKEIMRQDLGRKDVASENEKYTTNITTAIGKRRKKCNESSAESLTKKVKKNNSDEEINSSEDHNNENSSGDKSEKNDYWEDIYGRLRDEQGNVIKLGKKDTKYIPPAKRLPAKTEDEKKKKELERLRKQLKGLINRLSESNLKPVSSAMEDLYMSHSRNDMNETLTSLICEAIIQPFLTPERLVMEHAMLVALLHANVGTEVGAHFLQSLATKFNILLNSGPDHGQGKECDNLLALMAHLYNFKVTHSVLIYDILRCLAKHFKEKDIELILLILKSVGLSLRKDDPLTLKDVILDLQSKSVDLNKDCSIQARVRFMLDILMAIRNNNMHKIPNYDPSLVEHLRKVLRGFVRKGCSVQELRISLEDLLNAEEKGRWWIVGSAWSGQITEKDSGTTTVESGPVLSDEVSDFILELARKQRMNTDVRKKIFCIIMTAEDFLDAFEKLLRLGLNKEQEREIILVMMDCCLQESRFNPYYGHLIQRFCEADRRFQMALQFALWDKFKELGNLKKHQLTNLAQLLIHQLTHTALPLSVLKVIHFAEMDKTLVRFLRQILLAILLHDSEETCQSVFLRIAPAPKLKILREGLRLFMHHFLLRNKDRLTKDIIPKLEIRVKLAEEALNSAEKKMRL